MATNRGTKDYFGNKVNIKTTMDAVKVSDSDDTTLNNIIINTIKDIDLDITTNGWITTDSSVNYTYYKEFTCPDILNTDYPLYVLKPAGDERTSAEELAFESISAIITLDGTVRVYVNTIPDTSITITLKSIPNRSLSV